MLKQWRHQGIELRPGASDEEIRQTENRHKVVFAKTFRQLYTECGGFGDESPLMDENAIRIWPLSEINHFHSQASGSSGVTSSSESSDLFVFADYSISAAEIAIGLSKTEGGLGPVFLLVGPEPELVANAFDVFIDRYQNGDPSWLHS